MTTFQTPLVTKKARANDRKANDNTTNKIKIDIGNIGNSHKVDITIGIIATHSHIFIFISQSLKVEVTSSAKSLTVEMVNRGLSAESLTKKTPSLLITPAPELPSIIRLILSAES